MSAEVPAQTPVLEDMLRVLEVEKIHWIIIFNIELVFESTYLCHCDVETLPDLSLGYRGTYVAYRTEVKRRMKRIVYMVVLEKRPASQLGSLFRSKIHYYCSHFFPNPFSNGLAGISTGSELPNSKCCGTTSFFVGAWCA